MDGIGFVRARQMLDQARPVARLLVQRGSRTAELKYAMGESDSGLHIPSWSERVPSVDEVQDEGEEEELDEAKVCCKWYRCEDFIRSSFSFTIATIIMSS